MTRKSLKELGFWLPLYWQGTGTGLYLLSWRIAVFRGRIVAVPLGIWFGCGRRGADRDLILTVCYKGISGLPLARTEVGIPFGLCIWIGSCPTSKFFLTFPLSISADWYLSLFFCFHCNSNFVSKYISIIALLAAGFCSWFCCKYRIIVILGTDCQVVLWLYSSG